MTAAAAAGRVSWLGGRLCDPAVPLVADHLAGVRRIAVLHLNAVGDMLFSLPALRALRERFPATEITSIIKPSLHEMLAPAQIADRILHRPSSRDSRAVLGFFRALRAARPDLVVLLSQSATSSLAARLSGAPLRVGFIDTILPGLLSHALDLRGITCAAKLLRMMEWLGAQPTKRDYVGMLAISPEVAERAERILRDAGLSDECYALFSFAQGPGPVPLYKSWFPDRFVRLGALCARSGLRPVIVGARAEAAEAEALSAGIGAGAVSLAGQTSLGELAAIAGRATLLIGIDSGPMHVAAAMGTPVVALFGPTDPAVTGPHGERSVVIRRAMPCSPCRKPTCANRDCMTAIEPEEVMAAAENLLSGAAGGQPITPLRGAEDATYT